MKGSQVFLIVVVALLCFFTSTNFAGSTFANSTGCSVRCFLSELQQEYGKLSCLSTKLSNHITIDSKHSADWFDLGGGWTLTMKSKSSSKYGYYHTVWTDSTNANYSTRVDLSTDEDFASPAFYTLAGSESMLAMGKLEYFNAWSHSLDIPKNLVAAPTMTSGINVKGICKAQSNCGTQPINAVPSGVFQVLSGTASMNSWNRFGYVKC